MTPILASTFDFANMAENVGLIVVSLVFGWLASFVWGPRDLLNKIRK